MEHLQEAAPAPEVVNLPVHSAEKKKRSFRFSRRDETVPLVPYPRLERSFLDDTLERESKEVEALCEMASKKKDENNYSK